MKIINPSEGSEHLKERVIVEGKIVGPKKYVNNYGGRWIIEISNIESQSYAADAILVVNENPDQNHAVQDLGLESPNDAILSLFREEEFTKLFQPGIVFRAEAIVGSFDNRVWFNVWQIFLLEPYFKIGAKQLYNEPLCQRRLFLKGRGVKENAIESESHVGRFFIGNMVHKVFQELALSSDRASFISELKKNPDSFLLRNMLADALLICGMSKIGNSSRISGNELNEVKKHIMRLVDSNNVQELLAKGDEWESEVPVSGEAIHGVVDLRNSNHFLELKTGVFKNNHRNQVKSYLIGEMIDKGFLVKDQCKGYLVYSNSQISEEHRVYEIDNSSSSLLEALNRFLMARHRLLLVTAGLKLPKINFDAKYCNNMNCEYFLGGHYNIRTRACHFYCQVERNWSCNDCKHKAYCTEHSKFHSVDVIDEANRIRKALLYEIEFIRRRSSENFFWNGSFKVLENKGGHIFSLESQDGFIFDPPTPGEKIVIHSNKHNYPTIGNLLDFKDNGYCEIACQGGIALEHGEVVNLEQTRAELNGIYYLLRCLDELQRLGVVSHREGIAFAGGNVIAGRPEEMYNLQDAIKESSITDIFCQSFSVKQSEEYLEYVIKNAQGPNLIVTETTISLSNDCFDTRGKQVIDVAAQFDNFFDAISEIKTKLENCPYWVTSPDMLLNSNGIFESLPIKGDKYFEHIIVYENNNITGLEYFLLRKFGKRIIVIGDANCVGSPLKTQQSKLLGLGDNLMSRVFGRGFPEVEGEICPKIVFPKDQYICSELKKALEKCRMLRPYLKNDNKQVNLVSCDATHQDLCLTPLYFLEIKAPESGSPKEIKLKTNEFISIDDYQKDLEELRDNINVTLVSGANLTAFTSGRTYQVISAPVNRTDESNEWLISLHVLLERQDIFEEEAKEVINKVRQLKSEGINSEDIAIMSNSEKQLDWIARGFFDELNGVSIRTPFGIKGNTWDYVVITCAVHSALEVDNKALYTMLRASNNQAYIVASSMVLNNHPFIRNMKY